MTARGIAWRDAGEACFFSSRRRHTSYWRDWSSDVCSSDLGGSPGIGKSTLTNMALGNLAGGGRRTLYVSGEESPSQIKLRAERLGAAALDVPVLAETELDVVLATLEAEKPEVCVIDSVQTLHAAELTGAPGSVGQV